MKQLVACRDSNVAGPKQRSQEVLKPTKVAIKDVEDFRHIKRLRLQGFSFVFVCLSFYMVVGVAVNPHFHCAG